MNWEELYKGYLSRCKSKPLTFAEFIKLRESVIHNKKMEENKKKWFSYE